MASAVSTSKTKDPLIQNLWTREAWYSRTGLTLEQAWAIYSPRDFGLAMKLWEAEAMASKRSSGSGGASSPEAIEATEAAYQALKRQGASHAVDAHGDHGPADDRGDGQGQ